MKVTILGAGSMGTACAILLAQKQAAEVALWTRHPEHAKAMNDTRENQKHFPGFNLPDEIQITSDLPVAVENSDLAVFGIPTVYLRQGLEPLADEFPASLPCVSLAKGIEQQTFLRPTEIILDVIGSRPVGTLCGPSHAEEFAKGMPASVVTASQNAELAELTQEIFSTDRFRVYTNSDLLGVELSGALKNVIAIAAGVGDGMKLGDNAKSALLTRGLAEMVRFGTALGGKRETFYGLAGIGDLITTCVSSFGRNLSVGRKLGSGMTLDEILESTSAVAEGVWTSRAIRDKAHQLNIEMPITQEVCNILFENKSPQAAVQDLMDRSLKSEWDES